MPHTKSTPSASKQPDTNAEVPSTPEPQSELPVGEEPLARTFAELKLSPAVLECVARAQFLTPTPIQAQFIPKALSGRDVMGQAKTGTGKTAAFLLPIFEQIKSGEASCQALILAPTRELALQIHGEIKRLGAELGFSSVTLYGGASYEPQIEALHRGVDIVVGTPGRLMDHMRSQRLDLSRVKIAVLDEADRMLDLGFRKDIEYILRHCPAERQTLLLSATIPDDIKRLAQRFMHEPLNVWTSPESLTVDEVEQQFFVCERDQKLPILLKLLDVEKPKLAIIFCGTKMGAKRLAERLKRLYISAREIHGDLQQSRRESIMNRFRTGKVRLLIATDVASRGIDVQNITHIINYDIPYKIEDYVHRIGRTGRVGKSGKAFTFVTREEGSYLTEIELLINKEIKRTHYEDLTSKWWPHPPSAPDPDFEPDTEAPALVQPRESSGKRRGRGRERERPRRSETSEPPVLVSAPDVQAVFPEGAGAPAVAAAGTEGASAGASEPKSRSRNHRRKGPRTTIVCGRCGIQATVPFVPTPGRPVYCEACYQALKAEEAKAPSGEPAAPSGETGSGEV
ncbi:MAG TPA: DEAD/DEAH box helicase [Planctomycetota bacterium]|jgi:ATP-dependent RNA helicase DeaD